MVQVRQNPSNVEAIKYSSKHVRDQPWTQVKLHTPARPLEGITRLYKVLLFDISYSMSNLIEEGTTDKPSTAHTRMDLAKHALITTITSLTEHDIITIATYTDTVKILNPKPIRMDKCGKERAIALIKAQKPTASTILHPAMATALEYISGTDRDGYMTSLNLFTDGIPTDQPCRGHVEALKSTLARLGDIDCTINTIGFGNDLYTDVLLGYAKAGNGFHTYISDGTMVGTTFVNLLATERATMATHVEAHVKLSGSIDESHIKGIYQYDYDEERNAITFNLHHLTYGQDLDLMIPSANVESVAVSYVPVGSDVECSTEARSAEIGEEHSGDVVPHVARLVFAMWVRRAEHAHNHETPQEARRLIAGLCDILKSGEFASAANMEGITADATGQVTEAFSKDEYFHKWGKHYVPVLRKAHMQQRCWNFKDPGVQGYGGQYFEENRSEYENVFNCLPPPEPTGTVRTGRPTKQVTSMAYFNRRGNSCHSGDSMVHMADGSLKRADKIRAGDLVHSAGTRGVRVNCVLESIMENNREWLVSLSPTHKVTPFHPVKVGDAWMFPHEISDPELVFCPAVYSFVLEAGHVMTIGGIEAVTLGHSFDEDKVRHAYFGSHRVVRDLSRMRGWEDGHVTVTAPCLRRDPNSGLVMEIIQNQIQSAVAEPIAQSRCLASSV